MKANPDPASSEFTKLQKNLMREEEDNDLREENIRREINWSRLVED